MKRKLSFQGNSVVLFIVIAGVIVFILNKFAEIAYRPSIPTNLSATLVESRYQELIDEFEIYIGMPEGSEKVLQRKTLLTTVVADQRIKRIRLTCGESHFYSILPSEGGCAGNVVEAQRGFMGCLYGGVFGEKSIYYERLHKRNARICSAGLYLDYDTVLSWTGHALE